MSSSQGDQSGFQPNYQTNYQVPTSGAQYQYQGPYSNIYGGNSGNYTNTGVQGMSAAPGSFTGVSSTGVSPGQAGMGAGYDPSGNFTFGNYAPGTYAGQGGFPGASGQPAPSSIDPGYYATSVGPGMSSKGGQGAGMPNWNPIGGMGTIGATNPLMRTQPLQLSGPTQGGTPGAVGSSGGLNGMPGITVNQPPPAQTVNPYGSGQYWRNFI
ncbi:MAG TPA: hypothetical protein VHV32_18915 [Candidatus Angelobacter sp.]|jgi:hypothetical protein|nr:hypothetical protein [Candidatus Angelobacter sp.]